MGFHLTRLSSSWSSLNFSGARYHGHCWNNHRRDFPQHHSVPGNHHVLPRLEAPKRRRKVPEIPVRRDCATPSGHRSTRQGPSDTQPSHCWHTRPRCQNMQQTLRSRSIPVRKVCEREFNSVMEAEGSRGCQKNQVPLREESIRGAEGDHDSLPWEPGWCSAIPQPVCLLCGSPISLLTFSFHR